MHLEIPYVIDHFDHDEATLEWLKSCLVAPSKSKPGDLVAIAGSITGIQHPVFRGFHKGIIHGKQDDLLLVEYRDLLATNESFALKLAHICAIAHGNPHIMDNFLSHHDDRFYTGDRVHDEDAETTIILGHHWSAYFIQDIYVYLSDAKNQQDYQHVINQSMLAIAEGRIGSAHDRINTIANLAEPAAVLKSMLDHRFLPADATLKIDPDLPADA